MLRNDDMKWGTEIETRTLLAVGMTCVSLYICWREFAFTKQKNNRTISLGLVVAFSLSLVSFAGSIDDIY